MKKAFYEYHYQKTSHDSFRRVTGAFEITLAAIEKTGMKGIRFQINTVVTSRNIEHMPKIAK